MKKFILIFSGVITWSLTMVKSGIIYPFGIGFWGANGHDGIWHIAVINSLKNFSINNPIYSGTNLENYHLGFDVMVAIISKLLLIPTSVLYFQILPVLFSLLIGLLSYILVRLIYKSETAALWSVFFIYFGTGFGWILNKGESVFWSQQAISTLINPPYALSLIIMTLGVISIKKRNPLVSIICFSLLPQIKIYAGILSYFGLFVISTKDKSILKILIPSLIFGGLFFFTVNKSSSNLILLNPGWFLETLFGPDRLNIPKVLSALNTYKSGMVIAKLIPAYLSALTIFLIGNLGSRVVALLSLKTKPSTEELFFYTVSITGVILPMIFTQKGTTWNTIQFFYYTTFACGILSGPAILKICSKVKNVHIKSMIVIGILFLTIPGTFDSLKHYLPSRPPAMLPLSELSALVFLRDQPQGIILTQPFDSNAAERAILYPPRPLQLYESTAYVSAYAHKPSFLEDQVNANILGLSWEKRKADQTIFFQTRNSKEQEDFIEENGISYIYVTDKLPGNVLATSVAKIYDKDGIKIYKTISESQHR